MERFARANAGALEENTASSVSSIDSLQTPAYLEYAGSTTSISSRPISITTPSYMNATVPARKPVAPKLTTPNANGHSSTTQPIDLPSTFSPPSSAIPAAKGVLFLAIAGLPHGCTVSYLEMMLKRGAYSGIVMLGNAEQQAELKQLKMNIYALIGRMGLEVGVQLELRNSWGHSDISTAVMKAGSASGDAIHGVLCSPSYGNAHSLYPDILALDESDFEQPWKSSVAFLHSIAKSALPDITSNGHLQRGLGGYFLVTGPAENTPTISVFKAACDSLINLLADGNLASGLIIDYAENVLISEPEPEPVKANGRVHPAMRDGTSDADIHDFHPGESPTKLWNMWAQHEQFAAVD